MTTNTETMPFMGTSQVAAATGFSPGTLRSWICRAAGGKSMPEHPIPAGKINGGWVWDSAAVARFLEEKEKPAEVADSPSRGH